MSELKDRQKLAWEGMFYSIQRIDLLIISICSAGVYVCLETMKFLLESCKYPSSFWVKLSGVFFVLGVIINFISQVYGHKSNEKDFLMSQAEIKAKNNPNKKNEKLNELINALDDEADNYSKKTKKLNYTSIGAMFLGLITLLLYFIFTF